MRHNLLDYYHHYYEHEYRNRTNTLDKVVVILNYREIVDYIEEIPKFTSKNPLDHTKALLKRLGDPQNQMASAWRNQWKSGSVCAYLDSMLRAGGYKVGLFTATSGKDQ